MREFELKSQIRTSVETDPETGAEFELQCWSMRAMLPVKLMDEETQRKFMNRMQRHATMELINLGVL